MFGSVSVPIVLLRVQSHRIPYTGNMSLVDRAFVLGLISLLPVRANLSIARRNRRSIDIMPIYYPLRTPGQDCLYGISSFDTVHHSSKPIRLVHSTSTLHMDHIQRQLCLTYPDTILWISSMDILFPSSTLSPQHH
ncbi:hypothetical protein QCA50_012513 [Cerrena zonata]|uniref:Uncharacterized protein n=1 Tax=Cerrena zonata TaxID=2478898 RepID=A0AAW0FUM4_9APHY